MLGFTAICPAQDRVSVPRDTAFIALSGIAAEAGHQAVLCGWQELPLVPLVHCVADTSQAPDKLHRSVKRDRCSGLPSLTRSVHCAVANSLTVKWLGRGENRNRLTYTSSKGRACGSR